MPCKTADKRIDSDHLRQEAANLADAIAERAERAAEWAAPHVARAGENISRAAKEAQTRFEPAPAMLPVPSQPQWGSPEHNWDRPPSPPRPDSRPAPPGFAPPRARSRCAAHLHHGLPVSPAPTPGSRRASGTSLPPPGETGGQSIQPTEAIQAV